MKRLLVFTLFLTTLSATPSSALDKFWVSFSSRTHDDHRGSPKYVMEIDELGNILIPPKLILKGLTPITGSLSPTTIITSRGTLLDIWVVSNKCCDPGNQPLFRVVARKQDLSVLSIHKTPINVIPDIVSVTKTAENNFVVAATGAPPLTNQSYVGYPISPKGIVIPEDRWRLLADSKCAEPCDGVVSSDGRVLLLGTGARTTTALLQHLSTKGRPIGNAVIFGKSKTLLDLSDVISANARFVLYGAGQIENRGLFIQAIDSQSLHPISSQVLITRNAGGLIDPKARFVLYYQGILTFQALDATGHPSGKPKVILERDGSGFDIVKD